MITKNALTPQQFLTINFCGDLLTVAVVDNQYYVPVKYICELLDLEWSSQYRRLLRDDLLTEGTQLIDMPGPDKKIYETFCLLLEYLPVWIFRIRGNTVRPQSALKLKMYKKRCCEDLLQAFLTNPFFGVSSYSDVKIVDSNQFEVLRPDIITRVQAQCLRAERLGLPGTLTLDEWLRTLEHFDFKCAYCQEMPGIIIEHFIPLSYGITGTTIDNCVPSCYKCNGKKKNIHPDQVVSIPQEAIASVRSQLYYLSHYSPQLENVSILPF